MLRGGRLGRRRSRLRQEEANPMASVANLADVMLVFACGLMLALILHWNVDLKAIVEIMDEEQLVEIDDPERVEKEVGSQTYQEMGVVYSDPETGNMYVISK